MYRELAAASPDRYRPDLAGSLANLGVRFSALGRPADALPVTEEAVAMCRELAAASPDRYRPDLRPIADQPRRPVLRAGPPGRRAAGHRGSRRHVPGAGRRQPGPLPPRPRPITDQPRRLVFRAGPPGRRAAGDQEAVAIRRELAAASPDRYRPDLARSLANLGVWFSALGRPADALPVTEEAVAMYRELAAASPDRYRPDLARSLANLAEALMALDRTAAANAARDEAARLGQQPDR